MKKSKSVKVDVLPFSVSVNLGGEVFESKGVSMKAALEALPKPPKILQKGAVTITGRRSWVMVLMPMKLRRLWFKTAPIYLAKQFERLVA